MAKSTTAHAQTNADSQTESDVKPRQREQKKPRRKPQPRYNVVLWDDNDHTYDYVIRMMQELFGHSYEKGYQLACEVDKSGRTICLTTTLEHAELKRDQIHAFGRDSRLPKCCGSMSASIEPVE
jgi:ATP-dependent Clp protease adaptor protein ClpS